MRGLRLYLSIAAAAAWLSGCSGGSHPAGDGGTFIPPAICALPFEIGPCNALFRVFASVNGKCVERTYGGCDGNENNFSTLEECQATCEGRPAD